MFDAIVQLPGAPSTTESYSHSPSIPQFSFRAHSPGAASTSSLTAGNGAYASHNSISHLEPPQSQYAESTALKTRVSELEVINDLFRGRVAELEASEQEARRQEMVAREAESKARLDLEEAKRRIEQLESELGDYGGERRQKRLRVEDFVRDVDGSREPTPLSTPS
jgi:GATA-binding protein